MDLVLADAGHPLPALYITLAVIHVGAAVQFLGSMIYSVFVARPAAERFFADDPHALNTFQITLAHGGRPKVAATLAVLLLSGIGMLAVDDELDATDVAFVVIKSVGYVAIVVAFWYMSFKLWPRRVFALPEDMPPIMKRFVVSVVVTMSAAWTGVILGVIMVHR
jgi:uncharacterized membrane protein